MPNIPGNHEKKATGQGKSVYKRGEGLGTGPVGKQDAYQGRKQQYSRSGGGSQKRSSGGGNMTSLLTGLLADRSVITEDETAAIIEANSFNAGNLIWSKNGDTYEIPLSREQWDLVRNIEVNVFYDDGELEVSYVELGDADLQVTYVLTDLFAQEYWTPALPR